MAGNMFPHLFSSDRGVNIQLLQEAAIKKLSSLLERCEGTKAIVWDESLAGPVGLIAKYTFLKDHGVMKMFALNDGNLPEVDVKNVIFITRPSLKLMDIIAATIHNEERRKRLMKKDFYLFFLPKKSLLCEKQLQNKGVYGSISFVGELNIEFFPVDKDIISMEIKDAYKELYIEGDLTCLHQSAMGLVAFQKLYGPFQKIYGKGKYAQNLWELTKTLSIDSNIMSSDKGAIDQLIIIDRSVDLMSVLATQLTYEGLIDELFSINNTTAYFPADKFTAQDDDKTPAMSTADRKPIILNSGEKLYADIRDKNFNAVGGILSKTAKRIAAKLEERHSDSVQEMKKFVENLPEVLAQKNSLGIHTSIAEMIKEKTSTSEFFDELNCEQDFMLCTDVDKPSSFIEDLIAKKAPLRTVLRLICIQCIAGSGLKQKILDYYKREIVQVYGIETLLTLGNLERAGLIKTQTGSRSYAVLRKTLKLTVEDSDELRPKDISYVHLIYAPLSIRIVENILKPAGWQGMRDILNEIPGPAFEINNYAVGSTGARRGSLTSEVSTLSDTNRVVFVFFLGGCTSAEVAALRFIASQEDNNVEFVIGTTKLVNKNSFLDTFIEE
uniref:CSON010946 protein n=1 Tax=Culicoides sonorensis TaxID=179676 RepID=A0A336LM58_CULSO